jgi:multicomponent Na+:H+ antiporter subunit E
MRSRIGALLQFAMLLAFWLLLSGEWRPLFIAMGVASSALVTMLTYPLLRESLSSEGSSPGRRLARAGWGIVFVAWLLWRIVVASAQVANFALRPSLPFQPRFVRFTTNMRRPVSRVVLANSITLVPGTLTVRLDGDRYLVHCLIPGATDDLESAQMQNLIGRFTGEAPEPPPTMEFGPLIEDAVR